MVGRGSCSHRLLPLSCPVRCGALVSTPGLDLGISKNAGKAEPFQSTNVYRADNLVFIRPPTTLQGMSAVSQAGVQVAISPSHKHSFILGTRGD